MAKKCSACGAELRDDVLFCTSCGHKLDTAAAAPEAKPQPETKAAAAPAAPQPAPTAPAAPQPETEAGSRPQKAPRKAAKAAAAQANAPEAGSRYAPITTGGYIGIFLLLGIPVIGLLLAIIWACGGCKKISKRNLSRAWLILVAAVLVLGLILGLLARFLLPGILEKHMPVSEELPYSGTEAGSPAAEGESGGLGGLGDLLSGLSQLAGAEGEGGGLGGLGDLLSGLSQLGGSGGLYGYDGNNEDIESLQELQGLLQGVGADGWSGLIEGATDINEQAEAANDGWPASLRPYPDGTPNAVASYRTEFTGTSLDTMLGWIEQLRGDGFVYRDFYDFGMSEADMLAMNGWWATDGEIYLSVSFYEGTVTVDHTRELPDLSSLFG